MRGDVLASRRRRWRWLAEARLAGLQSQRVADHSLDAPLHSPHVEPAAPHERMQHVWRGAGSWRRRRRRERWGRRRGAVRRGSTEQGARRSVVLTPSARRVPLARERPGAPPAAPCSFFSSPRVRLEQYDSRRCLADMYRSRPREERWPVPPCDPPLPPGARRWVTGPARWQAQLCTGLRHHSSSRTGAAGGAAHHRLSCRTAALTAHHAAQLTAAKPTSGKAGRLSSMPRTTAAATADTVAEPDPPTSRRAPAGGSLESAVSSAAAAAAACCAA